MKTFRHYPQFCTLSPLLNNIQKGEYTPNSQLIQKQLLSNRCFLKLHKIHVKTSLLKSLFNNVADLKAEETPTQVFLCEFSTISKNLIYKTPPSLHHLMCVIIHAHTSTCDTSLRHVKNSMHHLCYDT